MKKIISMAKDNDNVFIMDNDNFELNLGDKMELTLYDKTNKAEVNNMIINYLSNIDNSSPVIKKRFESIIKDIESIIKQTPIAEGKVLGEDDDTICIVFNLNNSYSRMNCELRVFYKNYKNRNRLELMIIFSKGSGFNYGYNFFKYFDYEKYRKDIKSTLTKYREIKTEEDDKELISLIAKSINNNMFNS